MTRVVAVPVRALAAVALVATLAGCGPIRARDAGSAGVDSAGVHSSGASSSGVGSAGASGVGSADVGAADVAAVEGALARADEALEGVAEQLEQDR